MAKDCQNIYRVARCLAKMQRLQAAEELAISESTLDGTKPNSAKICREVIQSLLPFITNEKAAGAGTPTAYRKDV